MGMKFGAQTSLTKIRTWDNCHSDICTCNIYPGNNCPHPEYFLTKYWSGNCTMGMKFGTQT